MTTADDIATELRRLNRVARRVMRELDVLRARVAELKALLARKVP